MADIERYIKENARKLAEIIEKGSSAEIHPTKDGKIKIYEIRKKSIAVNA